MTEYQYSAEEMEFGEEHETLGPDYERARRVSERAMAAFKDKHFESLVDDFRKEFVDRLWSDISDYLISDTEMNLQSEIRQVADSSIYALLHGHRGYAQRYVLGDNHQARKVRETIFEQFKDEIVEKGIQERDEEIKRLKETLEWRS